MFFKTLDNLFIWFPFHYFSLKLIDIIKVYDFNVSRLNIYIEVNKKQYLIY
ncbi:unknown [Rickettsia conorii str. Malish 7]|uniref:Uncharacterized protein n=1 Tax=Rickettsia conorii (strain ATCC VR-613 / Malish 7) TaxID=272944 RepID=Q92GW2_RICCN|nr:unknown [Rickettsia conorii str. Malish 7]